MMERPDWDQYFIGITKLVAERSTCLRRKVGAIIVKEKRILATGYNGAPTGLKHCAEVGCIREQMNVPSGQRHELCRGLHAEQNAIIQAALAGVSIKGGTVYCTTFPCSVCAKMLINAQIKEVIYVSDYMDQLSKELFEEAGIKLRKFS
jgi:dCMP deaminase